MKTSPNQAQSSGYSFAGNAQVAKRSDHSVSKKEITTRCAVICFITIVAIGVMIAMYNQPQAFPIIAYMGVAFFPILAVIVLILRVTFPNVAKAGYKKDLSKSHKNNSARLWDLSNTSGAAMCNLPPQKRTLIC